jgi:hypothetical protein
LLPNFGFALFSSDGAGRLNYEPINPDNEPIGMMMKIEADIEGYCVSEKRALQFPSEAPSPSASACRLPTRGSREFCVRTRTLFQDE